MAKTLEHLQIEYARSIGFSDWRDLLKHQVTQKAIHRDYNEVAKRYALEAIKADREMYKECIELYVPQDKWDEAQAFLSSYGNGLAKELEKKER